LENPKNDVIVQRGALVVFEEMFSSMDVSMLVHLKHHLSKANALLMRIAEGDKDEVCRQHASDGLSSLAAFVESHFSGPVEVPRVVELVKFLEHRTK